MGKYFKYLFLYYFLSAIVVASIIWVFPLNQFYNEYELFSYASLCAVGLMMLDVFRKSSFEEDIAFLISEITMIVIADTGLMLSYSSFDTNTSANHIFSTKFFIVLITIILFLTVLYAVNYFKSNHDKLGNQPMENVYKIKLKHAER